MRSKVVVFKLRISDIFPTGMSFQRFELKHSEEKLIQMCRLSQLPPLLNYSEIMALPFLFLRTEAASYICNPGIFSWIITSHDIILWSGEATQRYKSQLSFRTNRGTD